MIGRMRILGIVAALVFVLACQLPAQQTAPSGNEPAARVGNRIVTMNEVEERWRQQDAPALVQAVQTIYDGRRAALDAIVADIVIEAAAKTAGLTPALYTEQQIAKRAAPVTDADIQNFFRQNQGQMQGRGLDDVGPLIRTFLQEQNRNTARQAFIAELRKSGPPVSLLFDAPRQTVAVAADDASLGGANAPVTLVEFSDFQCPFCQSVAPTLKRIKDTYGDKVRIVWKDFPLTQIHPEAFKAAEAGNCAREQGKFWEMHDRLFANQNALRPEDLKAHAAAVGVDAAKFNACLDSAKYSERVQQQMATGTRLGINSTPTSFINGRQLSGARPYEAFVSVIDEELQRAAR